MPPRDDSDVKKIQRRLVRWGAWLGVVLGFACGAMPQHYHAACNTITQALAGISCGVHHP